MKRGLLFAPLAMFVLLAIVLYVGLGEDNQRIDSPLLGKPVPAFVLPDLQDAARNRTEADLRGEVFLLNVWATWCISCRVEHPWLLQISRDEGIPIIGINYKDDAAAARQWLDERGNPYRFTISDPEGRLGLDLGVYGAPETFLVDRHGVIRGKHVGVIDETVWHETLAPQVKALQQEAP